MGYINPLLDLPAAKELMGLPAEQRSVIERLFREIRAYANAEAENAWRRRKGPMALYWRWVATISRHIAHALSKGRPDGQGDGEKSQVGNQYSSQVTTNAG